MPLVRSFSLSDTGVPVQRPHRAPWAKAVGALLLSGLLASCGGGGGADTGQPGPDGAAQADYFPLSVGSRWSYSSESATTHYRVTAATSASGRTVATVAELDANVRSSTVYERTGSEIISVPQPSDGALAMALGPLTMLKLPLAAGARYVATDRTQKAAVDVDGDGRADDVSVKVEVEVVGFQPLTTPAGSFDRVAEVRTLFTLGVTLTGTGERFTSTSAQDDFYAPGIGLVRSVERASAANGTPEVVRTLTAYAVGDRRSETKSPAITARDPAPDTPVLLTSQAILVHFDEPMDRLGPTPQVRLTHADGRNVPVDVRWDTERILSATIIGMVTTGAHRLQLIGELEDLAANAASGSRDWTVLVDREGPSVVSSSPAHGATGVSTTTPITVILNEAAVLPDPGGQTVRLSVLGRTVPIDVSQTGFTLRVAPRDPLHHGANYTLTVGRLTDTLGNWADPSAEFSATWGTDTGRFKALQSPAPALALAHSAQRVVVDGTGRQELWIATGNGGWATRLSAVSLQSDGSWGAPRLLGETVCALNDFAAGDVNGDSRPDVVAVTGCGVQVWLQSEGGSMAAVPLTSTGEVRDYWPRTIRRAGQSSLGFLTASRTGLQVDQLWLWQASSASTFQRTSLSTGMFRLLQYEVADVNGDGRDDVLVLGRRTPTESPELVAFLQAADATFGAPTGVLARWCGTTGSFAVGDVNADGRLDVLQHEDACLPAGLRLLLQTASGSFESTQSPVPVAYLDRVKLGDVDGDGRQDLVTLEDDRSLFRYRLQRADGRFADAVTHVATAEDARSHLLLVSDLDGDGRPDVLTGAGVHLQRRASQSAVKPGVRAVGRLPGLNTGVLSPSVRSKDHAQEASARH